MDHSDTFSFSIHAVHAEGFQRYIMQYARSECLKLETVEIVCDQIRSQKNFLVDRPILFGHLHVTRA